MATKSTAEEAPFPRKDATPGAVENALPASEDTARRRGELARMEESITWAGACAPSSKSIPKVGAIIVGPGGRTIGRGRRGTGIEGDETHAELAAINSVEDRRRLAGATIYTTLEPCTPGARTDPDGCCTRLIIRNGIKRVFVGILDPNQDVTGKGIWELQQHDVEVSLFPHSLAKQIRTLNADFIALHQSLNVRITSPVEGAVLDTHKTDGMHPIKFTCRGTPSEDVRLVALHCGQWWPQPGTAELVERDTWQFRAHFGASGIHFLHIVTANELGRSLIDYYWKVVQLNKDQRARIAEAFGSAGVAKLGGDHPGIKMVGLPKGLRSEASVKVTIPKGTGDGP